MYIKGSVKFNGSLDFDYEEFSHAAVKLFLDCMHLIEPDMVDLCVVLECISLCHTGKGSLFLWTVKVYQNHPLI